ncbi:MAG: YicC/YloC family endoribonuclease [Planctomycetota bacterium]
MTGYGEASAEVDGSAYFVEVRSVNHRYLKTSVRLPEELAPLEAELEEAIRGMLTRGSVTVRGVCVLRGDHEAHSVNAAALRKYAEQLREVPGAMGVDGATIDLASLMTLPGVLVPPPMTERIAEARSSLLGLLPEACRALIAMREREGAALADELADLCRVITESLAVVRERAPLASAEYERRLRSRIEGMLPQADAVDVVREVAAYAERCDVNEEVSRLGGHVEQFLDALRAGGGTVGRKLDFIAQEMLREANTIASKSPDAEIARSIIEAKAAIDRIKEQVQNVE